MADKNNKKEDTKSINTLNKLDQFLKGEPETESIKFTKSQLLNASKNKINSICQALCKKPQEHCPEDTVSLISSYNQYQNHKPRVLYSEMSSFIYSFDEEESGNFASNIEVLLEYSLNEDSNVSENCQKTILKLYDHFHLAIKQKELNQNTLETARQLLLESSQSVQQELKEKLSNDIKRVEKDHITILGIFASIVLSFVGGLAFSSSVLQNIHSVSIYRLLIVIDLLAIILANVIYLLIRFVSQINNKDLKIFKMWIFNMVFGVIGALIIIAWAIDSHSLVDYLRITFPWIN